jgi:hypothetical protein
VSHRTCSLMEMKHPELRRDKANRSGNERAMKEARPWAGQQPQRTAPRHPCDDGQRHATRRRLSPAPQRVPGEQVHPRRGLRRVDHPAPATWRAAYGSTVAPREIALRHGAAEVRRHRERRRGRGRRLRRLGFVPLQRRCAAGGRAAVAAAATAACAKAGAAAAARTCVRRDAAASHALRKG